MRLHRQSAGCEVPTAKRREITYWTDLVRDGIGLDIYGGDRSSAAMSAALGLLNAGVQYPDFRVIMTAPGVALDWAMVRKTGKARPPADVEARLKRTWDKAEARYRTHPPIADKASARLELVHAKAAAASTGWGGQRGSVDCSVVSALHELGMKLGRIEVSCSIRDLSIIVGCTAATAAKALARLSSDRQWIELVDVGNRAEASTYRILIPKKSLAETDSEDSPLIDAEPDTRMDGMPTPHAYTGNDAFAPGAMGRSAARIFSLLGDQGRTAAQIAAASGLHIRTVRRHLETLAVHDLASYSRMTGTWARVERAEAELGGLLDFIAVDCGTAGRSKRRAAEYERQREAWAVVLELKGERWAGRRRVKPADIQRWRRERVA